MRENGLCSIVPRRAPKNICHQAALSGTLRVKLLVTSVGTQLAPSHLRDVLVRMSAEFEEAEANASPILFVNGIDGIGRRGPLRRDCDGKPRSVWSISFLFVQNAGTELQLVFSKF